MWKMGVKSQEPWSFFFTASNLVSLQLSADSLLNRKGSNLEMPFECNIFKENLQIQCFSYSKHHLDISARSLRWYLTTTKTIYTEYTNMFRSWQWRVLVWRGWFVPLFWRELCVLQMGLPTLQWNLNAYQTLVTPHWNDCTICRRDGKEKQNNNIDYITCYFPPWLIGMYLASIECSRCETKIKPDPSEVFAWKIYAARRDVIWLISIHFYLLTNVWWRKTSINQYIR